MNDATNSDSNEAAVPAALASSPSPAPRRPLTGRARSKVGRLPLVTRDLVNHAIRDGLLAAEIGPPAAKLL